MGAKIRREKEPRKNSLTESLMYNVETGEAKRRGSSRRAVIALFAFNATVKENVKTEYRRTMQEFV